MSAYLVDENHINYLVGAALSRRIGGIHGFYVYHDTENNEPVKLTEENAREIGQRLWTENYHSVSYRYDPDTWPTPLFSGLKCVLEYDPVQVLKSIHCYEYQTCEHSEWELSFAHKFCVTLSKAAINSLTGFDDAEWGAPPSTERAFTQGRRIV